MFLTKKAVSYIRKIKDWQEKGFKAKWTPQTNSTQTKIQQKDPNIDKNHNIINT